MKGVPRKPDRRLFEKGVNDLVSTLHKELESLGLDCSPSPTLDGMKVLNNMFQTYTDRSLIQTALMPTERRRAYIAKLAVELARRAEDIPELGLVRFHKDPIPGRGRVLSRERREAREKSRSRG